VQNCERFNEFWDFFNEKTRGPGPWGDGPGGPFGSTVDRGWRGHSSDSASPVHGIPAVAGLIGA
jgi:hypothetical protein